MERNTILAIVLSAVVLFAYQAIFPPPKAPQPIENKEIIENKALSAPASSEVPEKTTETKKSTKDVSIATTEATVFFSNMGGALHSVEINDDKLFPIANGLDLERLGAVDYSSTRMENNVVSFHYADKDIEVTKTYTLKDKNLIKVRMEIKNVSEISNLNDIVFRAFQIDESNPEINPSNRDVVLYEYSLYAGNKVFRKGNATKFNEKNNKLEAKPVNWIGFRDRYNAFIVKPRFETKTVEVKTDSEKVLNFSLKPAEDQLRPGETATYDFDVYAGPQNPWIMKSYGDGFEKIIAFSNFSIVEWISQGLYHLVPFLHKIFRSWGVAIILVSMLIYGATYPLTMQSMMSMRKMQEVQPKIAALKERFKNDPQKLNSEMMEIYRREKINPLGGCLPFLIQMPFFMALYQILWRAQYFQGQGFLWIKDLAQPDRLIILPFHLPFFGNELNILPIVTGGLMFLQQRISSKNMVVTDEQQAMQQKMMMYILPVMLTVMFYKFASSWAIYFLIFYTLSTATQYRIAKLGAKK